MNAGRISQGNNSVEISNKQRGNGHGGDGRTKRIKKALPLWPEIVTRGGMDMDEGEGPNSKDVGKPRAMIHRRCPRNLGQGSKGPIVVGREEQLVTAGGSQSLQHCRACNLLKENQVGVVLLKEGRETSQVTSAAGVERQKR